MRPLLRRPLSLAAAALLVGAASPTVAWAEPPVQFPTQYALVDLGLCTGTDCGVVATTGDGEVLYMGGRGAWAVTRGGVGHALGWTLDTTTAIPSHLQLGAKAVVTGTVGGTPNAPCARWTTPATPEHLLPESARPCPGVPTRADDAGTVIVQRTPSSPTRGDAQPTGLIRVAAGQVAELTVVAAGAVTLGPVLSSETGVHLASASVAGDTSQHLLRVDATGATTLMPCPRPADPAATTPVSCSPAALSPDGTAQLIRSVTGSEMGWFWAYPDGTFSLVALPLEPSMTVLGINNRGDVLTQRGEKYTVFHKVTCAYCMRSVTLNASSVPAWPANGFRPVAIDNDARILGTASSQPGMNTIARLVPSG